MKKLYFVTGLAETFRIEYGKRFNQFVLQIFEGKHTEKGWIGKSRKVRVFDDEQELLRNVLEIKELIYYGQGGWIYSHAEKDPHDTPFSDDELDGLSSYGHYDRPDLHHINPTICSKCRSEPCICTH